MESLFTTIFVCAVGEENVGRTHFVASEKRFLPQTRRSQNQVRNGICPTISACLLHSYYL